MSAGGAVKLTSKAARARQGLGPAPVVVLSRPQLGENVGLVARAMLNFGLVELRLVQPRFGWPNAKAVAASAGAYEVLNRMRIFDGLDAAIADLHHLYATTARVRDLDKPVLGPAEVAQQARRHIAEGLRVGYLFGPERTGLDNAELALADAILTIPLNPRFSSLNIAQAVLLCGYEWYRAGGAAPPARGERPGERPATKGELRAFLDYLVAALDERRFFRSATRRASLIRQIELIFERRRLTTSELHLLFGIIRQLHEGRPPAAGS